MTDFDNRRVSSDGGEHASNIIYLLHERTRICLPTIHILAPHADSHNPIEPVFLDGSKQRSFLSLVVQFRINPNEKFGVCGEGGGDGVRELLAFVGAV
jgi:hypothetical protein